MAQQYPQPTYGGGQPPYSASAPPPNYGQNQNYDPNYSNDASYGGNHDYSTNPNMSIDGKQDFSEAFKLTKPRYNDLWAGIAFIITFLGMVRESADLRRCSYSWCHESASREFDLELPCT